MQIEIHCTLDLNLGLLGSAAAVHQQSNGSCSDFGGTKWAENWPVHIKASPQQASPQKIEGWKSLWLGVVGDGQSFLPCKTAFCCGMSTWEDFLLYRSFYLDAFPPISYPSPHCFCPEHVVHNSSRETVSKEMLAVGKETYFRNWVNWVPFLLFFISDLSPWTSCHSSPSVFSCFPKVLKATFLHQGFLWQMFPYFQMEFFVGGMSWTRRVWVKLWNEGKSNTCRNSFSNMWQIGMRRVCSKQKLIILILKVHRCLQLQLRGVYVPLIVISRAKPAPALNLGVLSFF